MIITITRENKMAKKLSIANGKYMKDGQEKTRWVSVGVILQKDGKEFVLLDPTINLAGFQREAGKDMLMVNIFDDSQQQQQGGYQQPQQQPQYQQQQAPVNGQYQHQQAPQQQQGRPPIEVVEERLPF